VATASVGGQDAVMNWQGTYDTVTNQAVLTATGPGRVTVVLEQTDGKRAAVQFVQASGPGATPIPVDPSIVDTLAVAPVVVTIPLGGTGTRTFTASLKPYPPSKPGGTGSFAVIDAESKL
jgi:hypothetical protein